ncbi:hypothetical protein [Azohydromonas aeria]|uniref:hypothetical protein n=1 Tax=Azohydromonas aeria TaxID=2590212 RepID=UPI0012FB720E|nr:hypothetical protein [Azohydromonas aeria]
MTNRGILPAAAALLAAAVLAQPALAAGTGGVAIAVGPKHPAAAAVLLGGNVTLASTVLKDKADFGLIAARMGQSDAEAAGVPAPGAQPAAGPGPSGGRSPRGGATSGG